MTTKYFVVSDVHSFFSLLMQKLEEQGFDITNPCHKIILCGDGYDRGKEAKQMQDFLVFMMQQNRLIYVRGNHEDLLIDMVQELPNIVDHIEWTHHASNGTLDTLRQLTGMTISQIKRDPFRAQEYFYNTPFWKELVPNMVNYAEIGNYIFVHGWIPCFTHIDDWRDANNSEWKEARWWNGIEMWHNKFCREPGKTIVCGHWHCSWGHAYDNPTVYDEWGTLANFEPYECEGILAIDGCVAYSGVMNCIVIEIDN